MYILKNIKKLLDYSQYCYAYKKRISHNQSTTLKILLEHEKKLIHVSMLLICLNVKVRFESYVHASIPTVARV